MKLGLSLSLNRLAAKSGEAFSNSVTFVHSGYGFFSGSTFVFAPTGHQINDWMFVTCGGISTPNITGGSGAAWTTVQLINNSGIYTTLMYRKLIAGDAGATFTVNNGLNAGPAQWTVWRGVASVNSLQTVVTAGSVTQIDFSMPTYAPKSSQILVIVSGHGNTNPVFSPVPSAPWSVRNVYNSFGPKLEVSALSGSLVSAPSFTLSASFTEGLVGWLFELVGT